ncbi:MAG: hypothetical protein HND48_26500 [Chloroflexi bacterium]|nr:hypothetical protein [Chloroflexota bacterium]
MSDPELLSAKTSRRLSSAARAVDRSGAGVDWRGGDAADQYAALHRASWRRYPVCRARRIARSTAAGV